MACQKSGHRNFIRGIEDDRCVASCFERTVGKPQTGKALKVRLLELQGAQRPQVEGMHARLDALRIRQCMRNRRAHVRIAKLRQNRPVHVFHERMHDALRMYDHSDLRGSGIEQVARLNNFQAFIHQGRGIDRNLMPHDPFRMSAGLLRRD